MPGDDNRVIPVITIQRNFLDRANGFGRGRIGIAGLIRDGEERLDRVMLQVRLIQGRGVVDGPPVETRRRTLQSAVKTVPGSGQILGKTFRPQTADEPPGRFVVTRQPSVPVPIIPECVRGRPPEGEAFG